MCVAILAVLPRTYAASSETIILPRTYAASSETIILQLIGTISKSVSIVFDSSTIDLGDLTQHTAVDFTIVSNTEYIITTPTTGILTNEYGGTLGFTTATNNGKLTITPNTIGPDQPLGTYSANIEVTISAI